VFDDAATEKFDSRRPSTLTLVWPGWLKNSVAWIDYETNQLT
jgi:hypothetical protein